MRKALFILCAFWLRPVVSPCRVVSFALLLRFALLLGFSCGKPNPDKHQFGLTGQNRCGGNTPCQCGYVLASDRVLDAQDHLENCDFNTKQPALTLINGAKLDCDGRRISVTTNNAGNYENDRTAIWIKSDSNGSGVTNCEIIGFGQAVYGEFEYIYTANSVTTRTPKNITVQNNQIILGETWQDDTNGVFMPGWPGDKNSPDGIFIYGNYFGMARSPVTDKDCFLEYGSYIRTTSAKNVHIWFNYFADIHYGYAVRLLYDVDASVVGNTFVMPWERYQNKKIPPKWTPSGIGIEMYNSAKDGYPKFWLLAFNTFLMSEDKFWPPEPFGNPPTTGINHEYVGIRSGWGTTIPPVDARFNWWRRLSDGTNYSDADIARLVYGKNYTVYGKQYEPGYREIIYLPRLY